jgi:hypothetical protein
VSEDDVEGEERGVGEGEGHAERLPFDADVGEQVDPADGRDEGERVSPRARSGCGQCDHREELDRRNRAERQAVDCDVEADVHRRQHHAHGDHRQAPVRIEPCEGTPRSAPQGEDERGGGDPDPGHAQRLDEDEEQDGEGRSEVVEDRTADEEALGWRVDRQPRDSGVQTGSSTRGKNRCSLHPEMVASGADFCQTQAKPFRAQRL